jgi:putative peptide zinc metalloprotease protein
MTSGAMLASSWYRVASLRPQLRRTHGCTGTATAARSGTCCRTRSPTACTGSRQAARVFLAAMDGQRSVQALWELTQRQLGEDAPTQDDVIQLLGQLHAADLLRSDVSPDAAEVFERGDTAARTQRRRSYMNPMAIRLHLLDPDRLLNRMSGLIRVLWGRWGAALWLAWCCRR